MRAVHVHTLARRAALALALVTAVRGARAQEAADDPVPLRDADAATLATLAPMEQAQHKAVARYAGERIEQVQRDFTGLLALADTADPLAYVKAHTARFAVPAGARYDAACSRDFSRVWLEPSAVFAIGKADDGVVAMLAGKRSTSELSQKEMWDVMMAQGRGSAGRAYDAAAAFYKARGYKLLGPVEVSADFGWPGAGNDRLVASVFPVNKGAGDGAKACEALGNTAVIVLHVRGTKHQLGEGTDQSATARAKRDGEASFATALRRAGLDSTRYDALRTAAITAYTQASDVATLDLLDKLAAQEGKTDERRRIAILKQNVAWYHRHETTLAPVFAAWKHEAER
jgi:hypothetical protein